MNIKIVLLLLITSTVSSQQISRIDKIAGLSMIWKEVANNYPNYFSQDVGWDSLYYANLNKIDSLKTDKEYYQMLSKFMAVYHDGHTYIYTPKAIHKKVGAKIWPFYTHNKLFIIGLGKELKGSIPLGSEILKVNGEDVFKRMDDLYNNFYYPEHVKYHHLLRELFYDVVGTEYNIKYKTPKGKVGNTTVVVNNTDEWDAIKFERERYDGFHFEAMGQYSYIYFGRNNKLGALELFEANIDSIKNTKGIIFDLRGNRGGLSVDCEIAKYFSPDSIVYPFEVHFRVNNAARKPLGQYNDKYIEYYQNCAFETDSAIFVKDRDITLDIPIVILVNESTISSAETFIISFLSLTNAYVIGMPSQGSATSGYSIPLPLGGYANVSTQQIYYMNTKYDYIHPDLILEPTIENLISSEDVVKEAAIQYLDKKQSCF